MKIALLIHLLIVVLLSTSVLSQVVDIHIGPDASGSSSGGFHIGENMPPQEFFFPSQLSLNSLIVQYTHDFNSASIEMCVFLDDDVSNQLCQSVPEFPKPNSLVFNFNSVPASKATFLTRGTIFSGQNYLQVYGVDWTASSGTTIQRTLASLRAQAAINLGKVSTFVSPSSGVVFASSSNPKAVVWFGQNIGTVQTSNYNDFVFACLNSDENVDASGIPICDFTDELSCSSQGKDWFDGDCCGDSPYDECKWYQDKSALCGKSSQTLWKWSAVAETGTISKPLVCPGVELLSDGTNLRSCASPPQGFSEIIQASDIIESAGHDFICENNLFVECGGLTPYNLGALNAGDAMVIDNEVNFCTSSGKFTISISDEFSCGAAGLIWTGTKCCGEPDDSDSTYSDSDGACVDGSFVSEGGSVGGFADLVNYNGEFHLCDDSLSVGAIGTGTSPVVGAVATHGPCGIPLENALQGIQKHLVCSPQGVWRSTQSNEIHEEKSIKWSAKVQEDNLGCCPESQCWDGTVCRNKGEYYSLGTRGFRCQD